MISSNPRVRLGGPEADLAWTHDARAASASGPRRVRKLRRPRIRGESAKEITAAYVSSRFERRRVATVWPARKSAFGRLGSGTPFQSRWVVSWLAAPEPSLALKAIVVVKVASPFVSF